MKKRFISLVLALLLTTAGTYAALAEQDDPLGIADYILECTGGWTSEFKFGEPVTITSVLGLGDTVWYEEGMNSDYNEITMQYLVELGIDFNFDWVVSSSEYDTKLNLSIAAGDIPDIFRVSPTQLTNLVEADMLYDLTDIYEANISDFARESIEGDPFAIPAATFDGRLYAIPNPSTPQIDGGDSMYFRTDWLSNLGLSVPATIDELYDVMYAFANDDPDQNGQDDTFGFYLDNKLGAVTLFAAMYGEYPRIWTMADDGSVQWGGVSDGMKDVLVKLAELYKDGIIDPEFTVKDSSIAGEDIGAGKHGLMFASWIAGYDAMKYSISNSETADWEAYTVVSATDEPAKVNAPFNVSTFYVVSKDCEHPEALVAIANYDFERGYDLRMELIEPMFDPELHGQMHAYLPTGFAPANKNLHIQQRILAWQEGGDESELWPDDIANWNTQQTFYSDRDPNGFSHKVTFGPYHSGLSCVQEYIDADRYVYDAYTGADTENMIEYNGTLEALQLEYYTKIITGGDADALWDEFVSTWYSSGGDLVTEDVNDWYADQAA